MFKNQSVESCTRRVASTAFCFCFLAGSEQADGFRQVNKEELQTLVHEHRRAIGITLAKAVRMRASDLGMRPARHESSLEHPAGGVGSLP